MIETNGFSGLDAQIQRAALVLAAQRKAWAKKLQQAEQPAPPAARAHQWQMAPARRMMDTSQGVLRVHITNAHGSTCSCGKPTTAMVSAGGGSWECVCKAHEAPTVERLQQSTVARRRSW